MRPNLSLWQFSGFCLTALAGTLLHFLYDWTNKSLLVAPFSAVNESTAEHIKLLYFPMLVFALVQSRYFKNFKNFWCIKLVGIFSGIISIPVLFYTYNGTFGKSPDFINIAIFFVSAAITFFIEWMLFKGNRLRCPSKKIALGIILVIGALFVVFTFFTPKIPFYKDPITNTYGI